MADDRDPHARFAGDLDETLPPRLPLAPAKQALVDRLDALIGQLQGITFIVPDDTGFFSIEDELIQQVRSLIESTLDLMRDLTEHYDEEKLDDTASLLGGSGGEDSVLREIGAAISSELAAQEVASLAFVARSQLGENDDALRAALDKGFIWVVASNADTGLRRAGKALLTLDSAMREFEHLPPVDRQWNDLDDSLAIRRVYGQFRRFVLRFEPEQDLDTLRASLRAAARRIVILRDLEIYPLLRIYDRVPIRKLQKRILAWLEADARVEAEMEAQMEAKVEAQVEAQVETQTGGSDIDVAGLAGTDFQRLAAVAEDGRRLWSDLVSFVELLVQINNREELREHDRRTIRRIHQLTFEAKRPPERLLPGHLQDLDRLLGRDDELDRLLLDPENLRAEDLRAPLERLLLELEQPFSPKHDAFEGFAIARDPS